MSALAVHAGDCPRLYSERGDPAHTGTEGGIPYGTSIHDHVRVTTAAPAR